MANKESSRLIEIRRNIATPIRRAVGQRVWLTPEQIKTQGLKDGDYIVIDQPKPSPDPAPKTAAPVKVRTPSGKRGTISDREIKAPPRP